MTIGLFVSLAWLAGCTENEITCRAGITAYADVDGDGFGDEVVGEVCELEAGQTAQPLDCDDGDAEIHPDAKERCNGVDDDCDGEIDDGKETTRFYADADGDGAGAKFPSQLACSSPGEGWVENANDCDDEDPTIVPGGGERCGGGDEDCDGFRDDADDDVDPSTYQTFWRDADGDGAGNRNVEKQACQQTNGWVTNQYDCDDSDPTFTYTSFYEDADRDGHGDPNTSVDGCEVRPGQVEVGDDCDDTNADIWAVADWLTDPDGDGYGSGIPVVTQCQPPGPGLVSSILGLDCNEQRTDINPGAREVCEDGIDQDCNGSDQRCGPIGSYDVANGDRWTNDPPVYSCLDACALLFGGSSTDYYCSTSPTDLNHLAFLSGWGDATYCSQGRAEDFVLEPVGNPGYDCGVPGCSYSAYVSDNCWLGQSINYCWLR